MRGFFAMRWAALCLPLMCLAESNTTLMSQRGAARLLEQASWGPTPATIQQVQGLGLDKWLMLQFAVTPSNIPDQAELSANGSVNTDLTPLVQNFFQNAVTGQDQLRQRVAFALSETWVVSQNKVPDASAFAPLFRIFRDRAFDNYENLMRDVTLNPAMGTYLSMANNPKTDGVLVPNENYARELLQLFTIGANSLNPDGTPVLDPQNKPVLNYSQSNVADLARALTGWTYAQPSGQGSAGWNAPYYGAPMVPIDSLHDMGAKSIFATVTLPAGQSAATDLTQALHAIFLHPSLPPFVCSQLIEHLVTSNPSPAYVSRVSAVFINDGQGVRGNLKAVVHAILTDPEARAGDAPASVTNGSFGHLREPVLFEANVLRGLGLPVPSGAVLLQTLSDMGQPLFEALSETSFFSPGYVLPTGWYGPEFQIYTTQTAVNRINTLNSIAYSGNAVQAPLNPGVINAVTAGVANDRSREVSGAINRLIQQATSGQTVFLPAGTYSIGASILMTQSGVTLQCASGATLIADGWVNSVIDVFASNTSIVGCTIDGNRTSYPSGNNAIGVYGNYKSVNGSYQLVSYVTNVHITGCTIQNFGNQGVYASASSTLEIDHSTITGGSNDPVFAQDNIIDLKVHDNVVSTDLTSNNGTHGIAVHSTPQFNGTIKNVSIYNNVITQGSLNFCIEVLGLVGAQPIYYVDLHNNRCRLTQNSTNTFAGMDSLGNTNYGTVHNEVLDAGGNILGIGFVELAGNTNFVTVSNNLLYNTSAANGIGMPINGGSHNSLIGNVLIGGSGIYIGASGNSGTAVPCSYNVVQGNLIVTPASMSSNRGIVWIQGNFSNIASGGRGHFDQNQIKNNYFIGGSAKLISAGVSLENDYGTAGTTMDGTQIAGNHFFNVQYGVSVFSSPTSVTNTVVSGNMRGPGVQGFAGTAIGTGYSFGDGGQEAASGAMAPLVPLLNTIFFNGAMPADVAGAAQRAVAGALSTPLSQAQAAVSAVVASSEYQAVSNVVTGIAAPPSQTSTLNINAYLSALNSTFFHGAMSANLATAIQQAMNTATTPQTQAEAALSVALASSEYQVIH